MNNLSELIGSSPGMMAARDQVHRLLTSWSGSRRPPAVLIEGETGTGKGMLARALHAASPRGPGPFVDLNCAAIPETLLEAELFGYERGAFTDARMSKPGLFQLAHRGTLFLDEIGLLPWPLQAKLLAVLEGGVVRRLGATRAETADVWVVAATNADMARMLRERRFRGDLYHRFAVVRLALPPVRDRGEDAVLLAEHFLARCCADFGVAPKSLGEDARAAIRAHGWPGNVRELSNTIERASLLTEATVLAAADLRLAPVSPGPAAAEGTSSSMVVVGRSSRDVLREQLERTLAENGWNITRTAAVLRVSRNTVSARIARFGLRGPRKAGTHPPAEFAVATGEPGPEAPRDARWEMRRLTFLRLAVRVAGNDSFGSQSSGSLEMAADKLRGFGGRVESTGCRVLLAIFGLSTRDEHAALAGHCALVIRRAVSELARRAGVQPPAIGVHTAEIPVRVGGGGATVDADAGRRAWNALASAMETTEPGAIVATAAAASLMRRRFAMAPMDRHAGAFRVHGLWRNDSAARARRGFFAGRREELGLLESRFAAVRETGGQVVGIVGEPGIGKSRLLLELASSARLDGAVYLEGRCLPAEIPVPFWPVLQIVMAACDIAEGDPSDVVARKVRQALANAGAGADDTAGDLLYLLGVESTAPELAGPALKKRLFGAVHRLLLARSAGCSVLIAVEDLQWIDPTSEACLSAIVEALPRTPILLATTSRPGYRPVWAAAPHAVQITLLPLSADDSLAVIRAMFADGMRSGDLEEKIQAWAEGNPLFIEELSRAALERGDGSLGTQVPASIEDIIGTRLGRLPSRVRRLLATAAVIGREVPLSLLQAVAEPTGEAVETGVAQLEQAGFLHGALGADEPRCVFKHALVQETAYASLSRSERRALHRRALDAIAELPPANSPTTSSDWRITRCSARRTSGHSRICSKPAGRRRGASPWTRPRII